MPSPPRSVFSKGLFASLEEPGSWQAPGAAASVRGTYCPFTLSSLPVGGVHSCRTSAFPDQQSCLVTLLGLPGRRICLSFWLRLSQQAGEDLAGFVWLTGLDAGSISSQLNIVCLWLPRGTVALQTNAAAALTSTKDGSYGSTGSTVAGQNTVPLTKAAVG